ncbi:MAG: carbamoyl-phosphate synthase (glutamine-hydrolyzing) small subunit [Nitrospirae bacterium]|nr:MAG: carbamoyl-phosphate synthase (glutamine-hydrolyzing) small subunit [Nitrospirota bacterium]
MNSRLCQAQLVLEDGSTFRGWSFGFQQSVAGEVVFNTGMVGYPEALTDPSYAGQILTLTYPLIGNYGVPISQSSQGLTRVLESEIIHACGLVIANYSPQFSHWSAAKSLDAWLQEQQVAGLYGVDTRRLTKRLRQQGSLLGKIVKPQDEKAFYDPNAEALVARVSPKEPVQYGQGAKRVVVVDCGCKHNILRSLLSRGVTVRRVPWNYDFLAEDFDGVVVSNGPGDPKMCPETVALLKKLLQGNRPILGICLGHQLLARAAGAETYKLKFGHRSQNQPCLEVGTQRCYITSQNHGFAVKTETLPPEWRPWFVNANDGTNEGIRHRRRPFMGIQFHPEAAPGPVDTDYLFDQFVAML